MGTKITESLNERKKKSPLYSRNRMTDVDPLSIYVFRGPRGLLGLVMSCVHAGF